MFKKITWAHLFILAGIASLVLPYLIAAAIDVGDRDSFFRYQTGPALQGYVSIPLLKVIYGVYIVRLLVPALIFRLSPSNHTRGMLTYGLKGCYGFEILLAIVAVQQLLTNHMNEGLQGLGAVLFIVALLLVSILAQTTGMVYGAVRGFEKKRAT